MFPKIRRRSWTGYNGDSWNIRLIFITIACVFERQEEMSKKIAPLPPALCLLLKIAEKDDPFSTPRCPQERELYSGTCTASPPARLASAGMTSLAP
jgi:hypothetical protein